MSSKPLIIIASLLVLVVLASCQQDRSASDQKPTIGIIQTAAHLSLDQTREGFITELSRLLNGNVQFIIQNAEGSSSQAQSIAENYHSHRKVQAIFAIGTPAVQAAARTERHKPIFIAAVSDPESLGVLAHGNICGTSDRLNTDSQADLIQTVLPNIQTVSLVYNPGENNSQAMAKSMQEVLQQKGIQSLSFGVHTEAEIAQTIAAAARKAEALWMPADNLLAAAISLVAKEALNKKCPLFASHTEAVSKGAFLAMGVDYFELGKNTAELALQVLAQGKQPNDIGVIHPNNTAIFLNQTVADQLQIEIPDNLRSSMTLIQGKGEGK